MKKVFANATILYGEELEPVSGYVIVEDGVIKEVGEGRSGSRNAIDIKRGIIFPAFTNAHVHLGDTIAQDAGAYESIGRRVGRSGVKFKFLRKKVSGGIAHSMREMSSLGITTFCDFREGGIKGIEEIKKVRREQEAVILGRPNGDSIDKVLSLCDGIGVSSVKDYSARDLKKISEAVRKKGKLLAVHASETEDDLEKVLKLKPSFLVHLTNASKESLRKVFSLSLPVVLCPRANAMLGAGLPNIKEILENTTAALGTDNVMVNSLDMFREMEFAFKVVRGLNKDFEFRGEKILKAATLNGRKALGLQSNAIEEENEANFIILGGRKYLYDPVLAVIHRCAREDIKAIVKRKNVQENFDTDRWLRTSYTRC